MLPVELLSGARRDFDESFDWYTSQSPRAALRFAEAVDAALISIAANPLRFAGPDGIHREHPLKKFPFRIDYRKLEDRILVVAIAHAKRRPGYWHDRT
jgi:plasmid stabilization system protein ParE